MPWLQFALILLSLTGEVRICPSLQQTILPGNKPIIFLVTTHKHFYLIYFFIYQCDVMVWPSSLEWPPLYISPCCQTALNYGWVWIYGELWKTNPLIVDMRVKAVGRAVRLVLFDPSRGAHMSAAVPWMKLHVFLPLDRRQSEARAAQRSQTHQRQRRVRKASVQFPLRTQTAFYRWVDSIFFGFEMI